MLEAQRAEHIERLIEGIEMIGPGSSFERFGAKFLDHHLELDLVHRGLNVQQNPIGGTVDSVDDASVVAAEYSIEKGYFQGAWAKPTKDMLHVLRTHQDIQDIYLLSSQSTSVADIAAAKARIACWPGFENLTIHFYDARRIAEVITDELLLDDAALGDLVEHLPVLGRILNEDRATLGVPQVDPFRVALKTVEQAIEASLSDENPVVALSGIGGSGKSNAAAAYVAAKGDDYQTPMWVEGAEISKLTDLTEARLWRGGADLNVAGMLQSRRCLLVIDDLPPSIQLSDLRGLCGPGSHILVTRRETEAGDITIPGLTPLEAREILDRDVTEPCPEAVLETLMKTVGGHPFSLALVNKAIRQNFRWSDIAEDCGVVGEFADGRERLADRILGRLQPFLAAELAIFDWAGQSTCDYRFLKFVIRTPGLTKIGGQGLLAADRPSIARLHDIVYACLKVQAWLTPERERALDDRLEEHLAKLVEEESLSLRIFATTMRAKLETLATKGRATPGILIALLEIWEPNEVNVGAVGNPEDHVVRLETKGGDISHTEIRFVLEAIEGLYRREKLQSYENAKVNYKARLPLFERLLAIKSLSPRSSSEVRHHWAKALKILGRIDEAREQFESVMSGPHPLDSTRLQLVRLYARDNQRAGVLADEILTAAGTPFSVTASVVLGVVENLSWAKGPWLEALFMKHSDLIEREILAAAEAGLNQAYSALASIGRHWAWHDPSRMIRIAVKLPMPSVDAADDRTRAALGEILAKAATSGGPDGRSLQEQALEFYSSIRNPVDFHLQKYGELLIEMGRFKDAEAVLGRIEKIETKAFAAYRMSQARLGQDDPEHAESLIDAAINALQPDQQKYRSTFLAHRFVVRRALHKYDALADLDEAIAACEPGKYQDHLKELRRSHRVQTASRSQKQT